MAKQLNNEKFNIEFQFMFCMNKLKVGNIDKSSNQYICMKQAFYAGVGQTLITMRDDVAAIDNDDDAAAALQNMLDQCKEFWNSQK